MTKPPTKKNGEHKSIRAKFRCVSVERKEHHNRVSDKTGKKLLWYVHLIPVFSALPDENRSYFESVPYGEIKLGTLDSAIGEQFEIGAEYYVTFRKMNGH
ncbi:MAG: hypothetical protein ACREQF_02225 [Candidatus Binataceae bacterium]